MMSVTTSIRLPHELRARIEHAEKILHHGKNWIIIQAIEQYLKKMEQQSLQAEIDRQCKLINEADKLENMDTWMEQMIDTEGWV